MTTDDDAPEPDEETLVQLLPDVDIPNGVLVEPTEDQGWALDLAERAEEAGA